MNFSGFFITRPVFAGVLSLLVFIVGAISLWKLPVSEYPEVVPPTVVVTATYPGANPKTIAETVASPLEQGINGVENMLYMSSQSTANGVMTLAVTFKLGTDIDKAQMQVQNRVSQVLPKLPEEVRRFGVSTIKSSPDLTLVVNLYSPDGRYDELYLRNFATLQVKDELARLPGVGQVQIFGSGDYAMRIWIDPDKAAARGLTASDVVAAVREQNVQVAAGAIGQQPVAGPVPFELVINAAGDEGSDGTDCGDGAGVVCGVCADGVHQRADRAVLPTVCDHDCDIDGDFGVQFADLESGVVGVAAEGSRGEAGSADAGDQWDVRVVFPAV